MERFKYVLTHKVIVHLPAFRMMLFSMVLYFSLFHRSLLVFEFVTVFLTFNAITFVLVLFTLLSCACYILNWCINVKLGDTVVLSLVFVLPYIYPSFLKVNITTSLIRYIPMSLVLCMYILSSSESGFFFK